MHAFYVRFSLLYISQSFSYSWFLHNITAAMLVPLNKETAAMLMSQANPQGIELYSYANFLFCVG